MQLTAGQHLAHYRLVAPIGEGGMGVVWKAVDTKLDREVAIKILPDDFARDPERLARFAREAKLLASLNQRNIAAIYGYDEVDGVRFLAMELVEGESLAQRLVRGALPVAEALDVCGQIARALEAAHDRGVVHRDLKPANVQVTEDGNVKVLDFGLAKALEAGTGSEVTSASLSPTVTSGGTRAGMILGTAAYMSPEQARGRAVDKRSDIWSFGCVLYESLTGRQVFGGPTVSDTLASILKTDPNWSALPPDTPPRVVELLERCLVKERKERLRDIGDAGYELRKAAAGDDARSGAAAGAVTATRSSRRSIPVAMLPVVLLVGALLGYGLLSLFQRGGSGANAARSVTRISISMPERLVPGYPLLSPDGRTVVFRGSSQNPVSGEESRRLYVRRLDEFEAESVAGSESPGSYDISPDGRWLVFVAPTAPKSSKRTLYKVPLDLSAPPLALTDWDEDWVGGPFWLPTGEVLAETGMPATFVRIPGTGGSPGPPLKIRPQEFEGEIAVHSPLPDGRHALARGWSWDDKGFHLDVALVDLETGEGHILIDDGSVPAWSPTGHLLFTRHDTLLAVPFDLERLEVTGGPVTMTGGLRTAGIWQPAFYSLSSTGHLAYLPGGLVGADRRIAIVDRDGAAEPWDDVRRAFEESLAVSPDGRRFAVTITSPGGTYEIWGSEIDPPRLRRLAAHPTADCSSAVWDPSGNRLAYFAVANRDDDGVYIQDLDSEAEPERVIAKRTSGEWLTPYSFTPEGSHVLVWRGGGGVGELIMVPVSAGEKGRREPTVLLPRVASARLSPDGAWLAYSSSATGRQEIYVRRFGPDGVLGPEIPVSTAGGTNPRWSKRVQDDGTELLFIEDGVMSATIRAAPEVSITEPRKLRGLSDAVERARDMATLPDGRFLVLFPGEEEEDATEIRVVLNWIEELKDRVR